MRMNSAVEMATTTKSQHELIEQETHTLTVWEMERAQSSLARCKRLLTQTGHRQQMGHEKGDGRNVFA